MTGMIRQVRRPDLLDRSPGMTWTTTAATHVAQAKPFDSVRRWWIRWPGLDRLGGCWLGYRGLRGPGIGRRTTAETRVIVTWG